MSYRPIFVALCAITISPAWAADDTGRCIDVEVNGQRAPSFACLTRKLTPSSSAAGARPTSPLASEAVVGRASNQLGLFNLAATGHRMGNTFGTSARPQRPPTPASPVIPKK